MPAAGDFLFGSMLSDSDEARKLSVLMEGVWAAQVVVALTRLGVPDLLAGGPRDAAAIAPEVGAEPDALARVLATAAVYGIVRRDDDGNYSLTGVGELLCSSAPGSACSLTGFLAPPMWMGGSRVTEVVRGNRFDPAAPGGIYDYFGEHPEEAQWFGRAMGHVTSLLVADLAAMRFRPLSTGRIVDVGGSRGTLLAYLLQADPGASGILFDRAEAVAQAPEFLASAGVADRVELATGSFLQEVPPGGDLYVLCQVVHNWEDEHVRTIVGNCRRVGKPGMSVMLIEYVLPDGPQPSVAQLLDFIMLTTVGGRERTRAEHEALLASQGYSLVRETPLTTLPWRVLEFQQSDG